MKETLESIVAKHIEQIHREAEVEEYLLGNKITKTSDPITEINVCLGIYWMFSLLIHLRYTPALALDLVNRILQGGIEFYQQFETKKLERTQEIKEEVVEQTKELMKKDLVIYHMKKTKEGINAEIESHNIDKQTYCFTDITSTESKSIH